MGLINSLRERINLRLYHSKGRALLILKVLSLIVSSMALVALFINYGFALSDADKSVVFNVLQASFTFYILRYIAMYVYDFEPKKFLKRTWFEGLMMLFLAIEGISYQINGTLILERTVENLGFVGFSALTQFFIQGYLLAIVALEFTKGTKLRALVKINPAVIFILTFVIIIVIGTILLMLPEMTAEGYEISFIDALFTATSASCVTGLVVHETATFFTVKGHMVLMILIKIGGLNVISFAILVGLLARLGIGVKHHDVIEDFVHRQSMYSAKGMFVKILTISTLIELVGSFLIFVLVQNKIPFTGFTDQVLFSVFHSVSGFNNAGFSTLESGMFNEFSRNIYMFHIVIAVLVFLGAFGFNAIFDLFGIESMRERMKNPWKKPEISTLISLYASIVLILVGAVVFYYFERNGAMDFQNNTQAFISSFFHSISNRSAGFNIVDTSAWAPGLLVFTIFLMFIGGGSGSCAGGIKTSTFTILMLSVYNNIRGRSRIEFLKKNIPSDLVYRAYSIFFFALGGIFTGIFLLSITEIDSIGVHFSMLDLIFEEVSAFSTVGLSTGITSQLSDAGRIVVILSMFIGRLGTITVAFALSKAVISNNYKYPNARMMIG